jgi:hypothetical protein
VSTSRRRWAELIAIFGAIPAAFTLGLPLHKMVALDVIALACGSTLLLDRGFDRRDLLGLHGLRGHLPLVIATLAGTAVVVALVAMRARAAAGLSPAARAGVAVAYLAGYALVSAVPQELLYRSFFFHRYRGIFGSDRRLVAASTIAFALLHVVFHNVPAVALTFVGGWLFSRTYASTRSLALVSLEHTSLGAAVFAAGLGPYFGSRI